MTSEDLRKAHVVAFDPVALAHGSTNMYGVHHLGDEIHLSECEAALLCARLLAILPIDTAQAAIKLMEVVKREQ